MYSNSFYEYLNRHTQMQDELQKGYRKLIWGGDRDRLPKERQDNSDLSMALIFATNASGKGSQRACKINQPKGGNSDNESI